MASMGGPPLPGGITVRPPVPASTSSPVTAQPSAAAAAGAAAAALLQRQLAQDAPRSFGGASHGWTEHQTGDGRKFYFHEETQTSTWEKPEVLMTPEERANDSKWGEYRIWDGRVFYHNKDTKVSCWRMPPELRKMREGISGIDDRPLPQTIAEKKRAFLQLLKEKGVDASWTWEQVDDKTAEDPQAEMLTENVRKQCFAELLSLSMRQRHIEEREKQRNAANALERLIEERFGRPEDLITTYEDASRLLENEEPWQLIKSDLRRNEVFQGVMERLEEKHKKARTEKRTERVVRLQRFIASDPELKRVRLRWKDAVAILARRDELQEEEPPLEALRVWASLRDLKQAAEHEAEAKARMKPDPAAYREDRKRRDAFVACLKDLVRKRVLTVETSWFELQAAAENEPRLAAIREGRGATAQELLDDFQEELRKGTFEDLTMSILDEKEEEDELKEKKEEQDEPVPKRRRKGFDAEEVMTPGAVAATAAAQEAAAAVEMAVAARVSSKEEPADEEDVSALDALIMAAKKVDVNTEPAAGGEDDDEDEDEDDDDDDPLMGVVNAAAAARAAEAKEREEAAAAAAASANAAPKEASTPAAPKVRYTSVDLHAKKVDDLKEICRQRGLAVTGRKQELVDRILAS